MPDFGLLLFTSDPRIARRAVAGGAAGIVVDWEHLGKAARQLDHDTQINHDTPADLRRIRACTAAPVICRINGDHPGRGDEVEEAVEGGADELLLPMVRAPGEVERVLDQVAGRCRVGILVETVDAVERAAELARLPLSRVYVGLNDLHIQRGTPSIFTAVADGTVERVLRPFRVPFGFGGLTLPDRGTPIPSRLLMGEMVRLGCGFSFLRRSFHADVPDPATGIPRIHEGLAALRRRDPPAVARDHDGLVRAVRALAAPAVRLA
ncbi:MAG: hypothetical protein AVDCRST_MAG68-5191 [uncultured Gemmatimonadetes bacterium]|uniref:HpcH/HpaI aldolase/citrate lyase domain-containing protein n=1 Tax=uncultured Gemmatimonadota bacterium TaxID=203437 RepID=A0A6J4MWD7_9BACT|nr:MAG: hypothetical protein AVDCRST_MAG68-5191 [uncultured Gemmatimonadota bacterium]